MERLGLVQDALSLILYSSCYARNVPLELALLIGQVSKCICDIIVALGSQCSCGRWVTPSFQVHKSKTDFKLIQ